jgi:hypothetical protein
MMEYIIHQSVSSHLILLLGAARKSGIVGRLGCESWRVVVVVEAGPLVNCSNSITSIAPRPGEAGFKIAISHGFWVAFHLWS